MSLDATLEATVATDVTLRFSVTASERVELQFTSGKIADATVSEQGGSQVWQWGRNRMFTQALQTRTVTPGAPLEQTFTWSDPPAGEYVAMAELEADQSVTAETVFQVSE